MHISHAGRMIDASKCQVTLYLMNKPSKVWQCRGCNGHLGKATFSSNAKNAPFNVVVGTSNAFDVTPQDDEFRKKMKKDVGVFMHFRPFCVRRVFPNAVISFLQEGHLRLLDPHLAMLELFDKLQRKYHVNTWV